MVVVGGSGPGVCGEGVVAVGDDVVEVVPLGFGELRPARNGT